MQATVVLDSHTDKCEPVKDICDTKGRAKFLWVDSIESNKFN